MLITEWKWKDALQVAREEGREDGREEARKDDKRQFFSLINQAKSLDELKRLLETSLP
jgi:flagellar biosynthesis/type III secretory pathway protein FliH